MTDDDDDDDYGESGPFCRHWSDPPDCEIVCAACGHTCSKHPDNDACEAGDCDCDGWKEGETGGAWDVL